MVHVPMTRGPYKGTILDKTKFDTLLDMYCTKRGWDKRGRPTQITLEKLGLKDVAEQLSRNITLT